MKFLGLYYFSDYLSSAGSLVIAICCLPKFKQRPLHIRLLGLYACSSIFFTLAQKISIYAFANVGVIAIGNTFVLFEAVFFSLIFWIATESKSLKIATSILIISYLVWYVIVFLFLGSKANSLIRSSRDLLMILNSICFFYYLLRNLPEDELLRFPMFWISASVLFFFSGTFMLSFLLGYIQSFLRESTPAFWAFRNLFRVAFCLVLAYAAWLDLRLIGAKKMIDL